MVDENAEATPSKFAKKIGFEEAYQKWIESHLWGAQIDWNGINTGEEAKTTVMFHSKLKLVN